MFSVDLQKNFKNMFVIKNKLSLSYRRGKSMHYPESPKVTIGAIRFWCLENRGYCRETGSPYWIASFGETTGHDLTVQSGLCGGHIYRFRSISISRSRFKWDKTRRDWRALPKLARPRQYSQTFRTLLFPEFYGKFPVPRNCHSGTQTSTTDPGLIPALDMHLVSSNIEHGLRYGTPNRSFFVIELDCIVRLFMKLRCQLLHLISLMGGPLAFTCTK